MASPLAGATVLDRRVDVFVRGDGSLDETTHLEVRLETGELGSKDFDTVDLGDLERGGSFRQSVACDGQLQLAELAAAEHCASARRLRLEHLAAGPPAPR